MNADQPGGSVDWARWTVVLCKPDAVQRGLVDQVLHRTATEVTIVASETVTVTDWQIYTHYWDLFVHRHRLGVDVADSLRQRYIGRQVVVALGYGDDNDTPRRVRALLGHFDPARALPGTIRGDLGTDSLITARRELRLVDNLVHSSDDATAAWRDFHIWFGGHRATELFTASDEPEGPRS